MVLKVTAAACLDTNNRIWSIPKPARHHDVLHYMKKCGAKEKGSKDSQGFKLNDGSYVDRLAAYTIAERANQIKPRFPGQYDGPELFSEDLW